MTDGPRTGSGANLLTATIPTFDPNPSGRFAAQVLEDTKVEAALIGRLAVWAWLSDESEHAYTKDLDVAVSRADLPRILDWLHQHGHEVRELQIGGVNVKASEGVNVDFITRSGELGDLAPLFEDAIKAALESGRRAMIGGRHFAVVPAEHLVAMKLATAEHEDMADAERVLHEDGTDVARVREITARFLGPVGSALLEKALRSIGHPEAKPRGKYNGKAS